MFDQAKRDELMSKVRTRQLAKAELTLASYVDGSVDYQIYKAALAFILYMENKGCQLGLELLKSVETACHDAAHWFSGDRDLDEVFVLGWQNDLVAGIVTTGDAELDERLVQLLIDGDFLLD